MGTGGAVSSKQRVFSVVCECRWWLRVVGHATGRMLRPQGDAKASARRRVAADQDGRRSREGSGRIEGADSRWKRGLGEGWGVVVTVVESTFAMQVRAGGRLEKAVHVTTASLGRPGAAG